MTEQDPEALLQELRREGATMIRVAAAIGTLAFVAMAAVDPYLATGEDLWAAQVVRVFVCGALVTIFGLSFVKDWGVRYARPASIVAALVTGGSVILLTYFTGGGDSDYHEALYVTIFGYAMLPVPWRRYDGPIVFVSLLVLYDLVLVIGQRMGEMGPFLTHNVLIGAAALTAIVLRRLLMASRRNDLDQRAELARANQRLTALDEAKSRFFANLSHELRTPLTLTLAPLEALTESSREPLTEGQVEKLRLAQRNALRLLRLVDDLLALSRAEAASLRLQVEAVDLGDMLRTLASDIAELAARKRITLEVEVEDGLGPVDADAQLVERVLLNLVGNAAKFVKEGGRVRLGAHAVEGGVELVVADDGIGIAPDHLPHVFTRFYQADSGSTRHFGGTGIGLALAREIVELHGGHIGVESVQGEGTTVRAWLPRHLSPDRERLATRTSPEAPAGTEPGLPEWHQAIRAARSYRYQGIEDATERRVAPRPRPKGHAPTVLVVEDNPDMIRFLVALLAHDFNVISAQNGVMGLRFARERSPDLVISDVMMPEMDGFEMARHLREDPATRGIPLIFLTARGSPEDRLTGHTRGADTYLPKPFRGEELLAAVDALLARQRTVRDAAAARQDEAVVYMASGVVDVVGEASTSLEGLAAALPLDTDPDLAQRLRVGLDGLRGLSGALRHLAMAGVPPVETPADVDRAVRQAIARCGVRGAEVAAQGAKGLHAALRQEELDEVVAVLLRRAVSVTRPGGAVAVTVGVGASDRVTLSVSDDGPALTPDQIDRMFFPFHDVGRAGGPREAVAMAYALRVVRARGGTVGVEVDGELGVAVVLGLPMARAGGAP